MLNRYREIFASLERNQVKYLIIGGIAAVYHGVPQATFDLDILIEATPENASHLLKALEEAQMGTAALISPEELLRHESVVFEDRVRLDVQTRTPGLSFEEAWERRIETEFQGVKLYLVSREDLIRSKKASGRPRDLEDVKILEEA